METKNYELFKFRQANRSIDRGLVNRLKESIEMIGYIKSRPILVDEEYKILDGQHRFIACKELDIPIYWDQMHCNGDSDNIIIQLNKNQEIWRLEQYISFYAMKGIRCYIDLVKFKELYKLDMSSCIKIFFPTIGGAGTKNIRKGREIEMNPNAHEIAKFLKLLQLDFKWVSKIAFVSAITRLFKVADEKQIDKLYNNRLLMYEQPTQETYLKLFESIINRKNRTNLIKLV
jgi:hypothetical protein